MSRSRRLIAYSTSISSQTFRHHVRGAAAPLWTTRFSSMSKVAETDTPVENTLRQKLTTSLEPTQLSIRNDSHKHAHHAAMTDTVSRETHFHVTIISAAFQGKTQPARHRLVYGLLKEEMARQDGIHALQLVTRTKEEESRRHEKVT